MKKKIIPIVVVIVVALVAWLVIGRLRRPDSSRIVVSGNI